MNVLHVMKFLVSFTGEILNAKFPNSNSTMATGICEFVIHNKSCVRHHHGCFSIQTRR